MITSKVENFQGKEFSAEEGVIFFALDFPFSIAREFDFPFSTAGEVDLPFPLDLLFSEIGEILLAIGFCFLFCG